MLEAPLGEVDRDAEVGERIRNGREHLGLSRSELARQLGANRSDPGRWESGERRPSPKYRLGLARILGGSPDDYA